MPTSAAATTPLLRLGSRDLRRLQVFLTFNLVSLLLILIMLVVLNLTWIHSHTLWLIVAILAITLVSTYVARWFVIAANLRKAAVAMLTGSWIAALGTTVYSPFLLPINALTLVLPLHAVYPMLPRRTMRRVVLPLTAVVAVALPITAVIRHPLQVTPDPAVTATIYLTVLPILVLLVFLAILTSHQRILDQAELLGESRARIAAAGNEARRRIERDLHDGAQQRLVSANLRLTLAVRLLDTDPERARTAMHDGQSELRQALAELRELAHGIYPPLLADRGVEKALESVTRTMEVPVTVEVDLPASLPSETAAAVYFCCLEAIQNATKHARATRIVVRGSVTDGFVEFAVIDDGYGIRGMVNGVGLTNVADRVSALGGTVEISSKPNQGTRIAGRIPLSDDAAGG